MKEGKDLAVAILKGKPKKGSGDEYGKGGGEDEESEASDGYGVAAGNILEAVNDGDSDSLASALREFVDMCKSED